MVALRPTIPRRSVARGSRDCKDLDEFGSDFVRIDGFLPPRLREKIWLVAHAPVCPQPRAFSNGGEMGISGIRVRNALNVGWAASLWQARLAFPSCQPSSQTTSPSNSLSLILAAATVLTSHSQIFSTRQPSAISSAVVLKSRETFRCSFGSQYSVRDFGTEARRQSWC